MLPACSTTIFQDEAPSTSSVTTRYSMDLWPLISKSKRIMIYVPIGCEGENPSINDILFGIWMGFWLEIWAALVSFLSFLGSLGLLRGFCMVAEKEVLAWRMAYSLEEEAASWGERALGEGREYWMTRGRGKNFAGYGRKEEEERKFSCSCSEWSPLLTMFKLIFSREVTIVEWLTKEKNAAKTTFG